MLGAQPPIVGFATARAVVPYATTAQGIVYVNGDPEPGLFGQPLATSIVGISAFLGGNGPGGIGGYWLITPGTEVSSPSLARPLTMGRWVANR